MLFQRQVVVALLATMLGTLSGCGGSDMPELGLVSGVVTLDGKPVKGLDVSFHPMDGRPAIGKTDADGKYTLIYKPGMPGCKVGKNRVTIGNSEGEDEPELEGDELIQVPGQTSEKERAAIAARYNEESGMERQVSPGDNSFNFDLKTPTDDELKSEKKAKAKAAREAEPQD
jgi:hypothetical protein